MSTTYYRQAITVKMLPATNYRPTRMKASCVRGSITVSYSHGDNMEANADLALKALISRFLAEDKAKGDTDRNPWAGPWVGGVVESGDVVFTLNFCPATRTRVELPL